MLVHDYSITIKTIAEDRAIPGRKVFTPKAQMNPHTGKSSSCSLAYSEVVWGLSTRGFSKNAKNSIKTMQKLHLILDTAKAFKRVAQQTGSSTSTSADVDVEDERAILGDAEDDNWIWPYIHTDLELTSFHCTSAYYIFFEFR